MPIKGLPKSQPSSGSTSSSSSTPSTSSTSSSPSRSNLIKFVPVDPSKSVDDFDLIQVLRSSREDYIAHRDDSGKITCLNFPLTLSANIDRIRAIYSNHHTIGINPVIACAVEHAIEEFSMNRHVKRLIEIRRRFNRVKSTCDGCIITTLSTFFRRMDIELPGGGSRLSARLPATIFNPFISLGSDLGITSSSLGVAAVSYTLALQDSTIHDHGREMRSYVDRFLSVVELKGRMARAVLDELGLNEEEEG